MANNINLNTFFSQYGVLNDLRPADGLSGDRRTLTTTEAISNVLERAFTPDAIGNKTIFSGIVFATTFDRQPSVSSLAENLDYLSRVQAAVDDPSLTNDGVYCKYRVYVPEADPRVIVPICNLLSDKKFTFNTPGLSLAERVQTLPEASLSISEDQNNINKLIEPGTLVEIVYANEQKFLSPQIIKVGAKIFDISFNNSSLKSVFSSKDVSLYRNTGPGEQIIIQEPTISAAEQRKYPGGIYEPRTQKAVDLLTKALSKAQLPEEWAMLESTHYILNAESGGKVGIPNYRYAKLPGRDPEVISNVAEKPETWKRIWESAKRGETGMAGLSAGALRSKGSTATGLGQFIKSNVIAFYPDGVNGIGDADAEAFGFVRYIHSRYGDPDTARSMYGREGTYYNTRTKKDQRKDYTEGY